MDGGAGAAPAAHLPPSAAPQSTLAPIAGNPAADSGSASSEPASTGTGVPVPSRPAPTQPAPSAGCAPPVAMSASPTAGAAGSGAGTGPTAGSGNAGSSGAVATAAVSGNCPPAPATPTTPTGPDALTLTPTQAKPLADGSFAFPASAVPPTNESPGFRFAGVPTDARSLALVFRDVSSATPPVKWILWDIAPGTREVPANLGAGPHPAQVAGTSQLGSLGNQGYAGPCCSDHVYEWVLYALDVASLPGTERLSTAEIRTNLLLAHDVAQSKPLMMRIMP
jgi:phosphatidylethanolamine-binding protein (PEBP) family uncharacterized protein